MRPESLLGHDYWADYCYSIFETNLKINRTIAEFAYNHISGTNIVFTNAEEDPWRVASELNPLKELNQLGLNANCTNCGHCIDLHTPHPTDKPEVERVRL